MSYCGCGFMRWVCPYTGLGVTGGAVLFGELARVTTKRSRTGVFSLFMATRQVGLVVGPAFNLFLRKCHFTLGPFTVDKYTAPAVSGVGVSGGVV